MMSVYSTFSGYNKSPPQNYYRKENPDTVQWIPLNDPNKQDQSQSIAYGEITTYQREGYMENANQRDPIQEQINKKGKTDEKYSHGVALASIVDLKVSLTFGVVTRCVQ